MKEELIRRIRTKSATVAVIGLGYVGLPTAVIVANSGFKVIGVDIDLVKVEAVKRGESYLSEPKLKDLLRTAISEKKITAINDIAQAVSECDITVLCVSTPTSSDGLPDLSILNKVCDRVAEVLERQKLVIVESTVPPGTTQRTIARLEKVSKLVCGTDFWCAYCPERMYSGRAIQEFIENDRLVGACDNSSSEIAAEFLSTIATGKVHRTSVAIAEIAKLAENTFRDVNIAFANELALICEKAGADVAEVIRLTNTHPRVKIHKPGCGVGGSCLPKDPYFLIQVFEDKLPSWDVVQRARELNSHMPVHLVELVVDALRNVRGEIKHAKVAVLGVAYKGQTDDVRNTPAEIVVKQLLGLGADVHVFDPCSVETFGAKRAKALEEALDHADCVVICTDHPEFTCLEPDKIRGYLSRQAIIVDGRRVLDPLLVRKAGIKYFGVGFGETVS